MSKVQSVKGSSVLLLCSFFFFVLRVFFSDGFGGSKAYSRRSPSSMSGLIPIMSPGSIRSKRQSLFRVFNSMLWFAPESCRAISLNDWIVYLLKILLLIRYFWLYPFSFSSLRMSILNIIIEKISGGITLELICKSGPLSSFPFYTNNDSFSYLAM